MKKFASLIYFKDDRCLHQWVGVLGLIYCFWLLWKEVNLFFFEFKLNFFANAINYQCWYLFCFDPSVLWIYFVIFYIFLSFIIFYKLNNSFIALIQCRLWSYGYILFSAVLLWSIVDAFSYLLMFQFFQQNSHLSFFLAFIECVDE